MDANRFDALVKTLSLSAARRGMAAGLLGGTLASLLAPLETAARRHPGRRTHRDDELSAEKRKKKKCKKCGPCRRCKKGKCKPKPDGTPCSDGSCQGGACRQVDEAPPCTDGTCPLPPDCADHAVEECAVAFIEATQGEREPCRTDCEAGDGPACQACLTPIVRAHLPAVQACIAASCAFPISSSDADAAPAGVATRHHAKQQAGHAVAKDWWPRVCDKPTCCASNLDTCYASARDTLLKCSIGALITAFRGGPAGIGAALLCLGNFSYDTAACLARFGCRDGQCVEGDICVCPAGGTQCGSQCCHYDQTCCGGRTCCGRDASGDRYCCGTKCCPVEASVCAPGSDSDPPACCFPGDKPCHGTCCSDSPLVLCCDKSNGQTFCYAVGVGCPA